MDLDDIKSTDAALVVAFQKFTTRVHAGENFSFWFDKGNNEGKYEKYIKEGAAKVINIDDVLAQKFHKLAEAGNYAGMSPLFIKARTEVGGMLEGRLAEFAISPEYKAYLAVKKAGNITKALKLLGLTGPNAKTMEALLKEYAVGSDSQKKVTLAKMQKIAKAEQITQALKTSGLM